MHSQSKLSRRAAAAILVAMTMCLPAAFAAEKSFDRTLSVNGPVTLRVSTGSGYIRVSPGSDNQVHIVGRVKSSDNTGCGVDRLTTRWRRWPPIRRLIRPATSFAWATIMGTTGLTMSRSTTRSRRRPTLCLWRRVDPEIFSSPTSMEQSRRRRARAPSARTSWAPAPDLKLARARSMRAI